MTFQTNEISRYIINGILATIVHFGILTLLLDVANVPSAGIANLLAAIAGITASFLGSRYFVFRNHEESMFKQALKFSGLYGFIAILHGFILFVWSDYFGLDYRLGFLVATFFQVSLSFVGNKLLVFNK